MFNTVLEQFVLCCFEFASHDLVECLVIFPSALFSSACCFVFCGKLDLLDPPIEKACYYLKGKHVTKYCVARNSSVCAIITHTVRAQKILLGVTSLSHQNVPKRAMTHKGFEIAGRKRKGVLGLRNNKHFTSQIITSFFYINKFASLLLD